ncbi:hypothetical protein GXW83_28985 [Streptacidiphilus sp. PB12-B1b]|uniref:hypothetical protein n=1 Tax=Streptacidiphilus sp. PB12-B1b TaxID=2705012 RepID=UPI0015FCAEA2|nr:hypothetical protein [Streptacidiphilus sp. PB12-B1b]QMU79144.1 hypothetical protein GXW83_28985 [Streptacidiphilus sp. PB12-B1b]
MSRLDPLLQLVLPFAVVGVIIVLYRWAARGGRSFVPRVPRPGSPDEYGLLVPVAAPADDAEALRLGALLDRAGVRNTLVRTTHGLRIMVWGDQAPQARSLLHGRNQT